MSEIGMQALLVLIVVLSVAAVLLAGADLVGSVHLWWQRVYRTWKVKRQLDSDVSRLVRASKHQTAKSRECQNEPRDKEKVSE